MALRMLDVHLSAGQGPRLIELVEGLGHVGSWTLSVCDGEMWMRILADSPRIEPLTDALTEAFESDAEFRVIVVAAEAAVPPPTEQEVGPADADEQSKAPRRVSREELYQDALDATHVSGLYLTTIALSAIVAAVGLIRGDVAVIIGAMVIAPLLGPNIALSLAATLGDFQLARQAIWTTGVGAALALTLSVVIGLAFEFDPGVDQLVRRTVADLGDVALALAAGSAGALAFTSGLPSALVGVMVAVALLPPLVAGGLYLGAGALPQAAGAGLLVAVNVVALNLAAVLTFLVQKVRPREWWEQNRASRAAWIAVTTWLLLLAALIGLLIQFG